MILFFVSQKVNTIFFLSVLYYFHKMICGPYRKRLIILQREIKIQRKWAERLNIEEQQKRKDGE